MPVCCLFVVAHTFCGMCLSFVALFVFCGKDLLHASLWQDQHPSVICLFSHSTSGMRLWAVMVHRPTVAVLAPPSVTSISIQGVAGHRLSLASCVGEGSKVAGLVCSLALARAQCQAQLVCADKLRHMQCTVHCTALVSGSTAVSCRHPAGSQKAPCCTPPRQSAAASHALATGFQCCVGINVWVGTLTAAMHAGFCLSRQSLLAVHWQPGKGCPETARGMA